MRLAIYKEPEQKVVTNSDLPPISVIICARNEAENLKERLPAILEQDYPHFEVLVVNDRSTDDSRKILKEFSHKYEKLKILTIEEGDESVKGKKFALSKGIEQSTYVNLLLTDADCTPSSAYWIREMVKRFSDKQKIVFGYGPYEKRSGFLNKFIRYETAHTALQYFSLALWGLPYMGVGRNLAYKKELYLNNQGFVSHQHISSGDDDLFIKEVANKHNTDICMDNRTFMYSKPETNYKNLYVQKTRHFSTGKYYSKKVIAVLSAYSMSHFVFILSFVTFILFDIDLTTAMILLLIRMMIQVMTFSIILRKLGEPDLIKFIPLFDILYVVYYVLFTPAVMLNKTKQWKK